MSNDVCQLVPIIKGKQSRFYNELKTYVGGDRKLTNFLYAISVQDIIKNQFLPNELNSQGEPQLNAFVQKFHINEFTSYKTKLTNDAKALGAIDSDGNIIIHKTMDDITQKVLDYNNTHEYAKAQIKFRNDGFYIELDSLNSENFASNAKLEYNLARYDILMQYLKDLGFKTDLSEQTKQFMNPLNINYVNNILAEISHYDPKKHGSLINRQIVSLFIDLFNDTPLMERIKQLPVEDLSIVDVVTMCLSDQQINEYIASFDVSEQQQISSQLVALRDLSRRFVGYAINEFKTKYKPTVIQLKEAKLQYKETKYEDIDAMDINKTLKQLYKCYHIDMDLLESIQTQIKSLSDAANYLLKTASNVSKINEQRSKEPSEVVSENQLGETVLEQIEKKFRTGQYALAISELLQHLQTELGQYEAKLKRLEKNDGAHDALWQIAQISTILVQQQRTVESFKDVISQLQDVKTLDADGFGATPELLSKIQTLSKDIQSLLSGVETNINKQKFENVYAFLKLYWGEDKVDQGKMYSLREMLSVAASDVGFLDRFAYSFHECSDPVIALLGQSVKEQHEKRDKILLGLNNRIRIATDKLYRSGSNTNFMFVTNEKGEVIGIQSRYNYKQWYEDRNAYKKQLKEQNVSSYEYKRLMKKWDFDNQTLSQDEFGLEMFVPSSKYDLPDFQAGWTTAQKEYYNTMMQIKADLTDLIGGSAPGLYTAIQLSDDILGAIDSAQGDADRVWSIVNDKFNIKKLFKKREDEVDYGQFYDSPLQETSVDPSGHKVIGMPLFYTNKLEDARRVTKDFSRAMMAFCATGTNYVVMDEIQDTLLLAKDLLMDRKTEMTSGNKLVGKIWSLGKQEYLQPSYKQASQLSSGKMLDDMFDRFFGKNKNVWEGTLFGHTVQYDKWTDRIIGYTSTVGLTANLLGGTANVLVGKLQMLIDTGFGLGGEFFNMRDMVAAEGQYWKHIPAMIAECTSNNIKDKVSLLGQMFNVSENFYEELAQNGFYKKPISKILGNKSLFFLYGMGEHLLHTEGMLACMNNIKVIDKNGNKGTLYNVFDVVLDESGRNGKIVLKDGYQYLDRKGNVAGDVNEEYIDKIKKRISYVNKTMHGAFNQDDKSTAHKYALGRLFWNFRQWMPEHYSRRFRGRYYNAELGEFREGYYTTSFKFVADCVTGLKNNKYYITTRWNEMDDWEKYNIKRSIAETALLALTSGLVLLASTDDKDKKKNWAYKAMLYELKRVEMETRASTFLQKNPLAFIDNLLNIMNQPFAQIKTIQSLESFLNVTDMFRTVEAGKYKGRNKYLHKNIKNIPIVGQAIKQVDFDDSMFRIFD